MASSMNEDVQLQSTVPMNCWICRCLSISWNLNKIIYIKFLKWVDHTTIYTLISSNISNIPHAMGSSCSFFALSCCFSGRCRPSAWRSCKKCNAGGKPPEIFWTELRSGWNNRWKIRPLTGVELIHENIHRYWYMSYSARTQDIVQCLPQGDAVSWLKWKLPLWCWTIPWLEFPAENLLCKS